MLKLPLAITLVTIMAIVAILANPTMAIGVMLYPKSASWGGTWTDISKETEKKLNQLQSWFCCKNFQVGQGAPLASMSWDLSVLDVGLRVMMDKIMLVSIVHPESGRTYSS